MNTFQSRKFQERKERQERFERRKRAIEWWKLYSKRQQRWFCDNHEPLKGRTPDSITGREIEELYMTIVKTLSGLISS